MLSIEPLKVEMPVSWQVLSGAVPTSFENAAESYAKYWRAPRTIKRRYSSWMKILRLSLRERVCPLPMTPGTAAGILAHVAEGGASYSELRALRDCITFVHEHKDLPDPTRSRSFRRVWAGIRRSVGTGNPNRKAALTRDEVGEMIECARREQRPDHAVALAVAFEGALRVAELCALTVDDVYVQDGSVQLYVARSKSDQTGLGAMVTLEVRSGAPFNAPKMLVEWLEGNGPGEGYLLTPFRRGRPTGLPLDGRTFTRMVKTYYAKIGGSPRIVASHSMRAGWITAELSLGRPESQVAAHVRHSDLSSMLGYYRPRTPRNLVRHAAGGVA